MKMEGQHTINVSTLANSDGARICSITGAMDSFSGRVVNIAIGGRLHDAS